jgi:hypothetical protein
MLKNTGEGITAEYIASQYGYIIVATIDHNVINARDIVADVVFEIYIEGKFPFQAPKILAKTDFTAPSLADGRDLIPNLLKSAWNPSITLIDIVNALPRFASDCADLVSINDIWDLGAFHLGHPLTFEIWENKPSMARFYCIETDPTDPR